MPNDEAVISSVFTFPPDIGLLLYASTGLAMLIGLVFLLVARRMAQTWMLPHWAAGLLVLGLGNLGYAMTHLLPGIVSSVVANALFVIGLLLFHAGARRVNAKPPEPDWIGIFLLVVSIVCMLWFNYIQPDLGRRVLVLSVVTALLAGQTAFELSVFAGRKGSPFPANVLASLWWFLAAIMVMTAIAMLVYTQHSQDLHQAGPPILTLFYLRPLLMLLVCGFGLYVELRLLATNAPAPLEAAPAAARADFDAQCEAAVAQRGARPLSVVLVDMDDFRQIAKRHGRKAAQAVLNWVGDEIRSELGPADVLSHYGNDQYAILLPNTDGDSAAQFGEDLRRRIQAGHTMVGKKAITTTVSVGVADCTPERNSAKTLAAAAKVAIYQARAAGRNRVQVAKGSLEEADLAL